MGMILKTPAAPNYMFLCVGDLVINKHHQKWSEGVPNESKPDPL